MELQASKTLTPLQKVVVVDDDPLFRESLGQNLVDADFCVENFADGRTALQYLGGSPDVDLVLLDWKMPEMNGIEVLREMRESGLQVPVIFLTVLSDQIFEEAALQGGAVDFVEKSRSFAILLKRIDLILAGSKGRSREDANDNVESGQHLELDELSLDLDTSRALWKGAQVELSFTEFKIVHFMSARAGRDIRYRDLYDIVHGEGFISGSGADGYRANVRAFIKRIRQKFREIDDSFDRIENYPGFGYRWRPSGVGAD